MTRESVGADLSGIGILVTGVTPSVADGLRQAWSGFLAEAVADPWLVVTVEDVETKLTAGREMKAGTATAREGARVRAARDEGGATIDAASGRAHVRLASGDLARMHGIDERIDVRDYERTVRFYRRLIQEVASR